MKNKWIIIVVILAALGSIAFQFNIQNLQPEYKEILDQKLEKYRQQKIRNCKQRAIEAAKSTVDSLFREHFANLRIDSVTTPDRGNRPERPKLDIPKVKSELGPIITREEFDSLMKKKVEKDSIQIN